MQGASLTGILEGKAREWRDEFFYEHQFIRASWGHKPYIPGVEGVVEPDRKYMRYLHGGDTVVYEELFLKDVGTRELNNLIDDPAYEAVARELRGKTDNYLNILR
jgi:hypothetical protein